MKKLCFILILGTVLFMSVGTKVWAGEIDILVDKLVEKGILSPVEAQIILDETKQEVVKELSQGKSYALPGWVQRTKLKGDLRLRYQYDDKDLDSKSGRHRGRVRFRLGMESKVTDKLDVAAGLATGSDDPRSTNQTLKDTFSTKGIQLDYAYLKYNAAAGLDLYGGKMKRKPVLWEPTDLLWDGDVNPEGAAFHFEKNTGVPLFFNAGGFIIDADASDGDRGEPWMVYFQPGLEHGLTKNIKLKAAVTGYIVNTSGWDIDNSNVSNTLAGSTHKYDYDSISPAFELSIKKPMGGIVPYGALFGEYIRAFDASTDENGWAAGFKFGEKKVKKPGQWQAKYIYRRLERDAWADFLPDSDAYDGDTNVKGHEVAFTYGLAKNVTLGLDYYYTQPIDTLSGVSDHSLGSENEQHVVQVDVVAKF